MAFLGKTFLLQKNENFEEILKKIGFPSDVIEAAMKSKPSVKMTKDGDYYTFTYIDETGPKPVKFVNGVEFDESYEGFVSKTTITVDGNVFNHLQKISDGGTLITKREFNDNTLLETLTTNKWDGVCRRHYTAA